MSLRLGVLASHPIQYYSPIFRELACRPGVDLTVHYAIKPTPAQQGIGFGVDFEWDTDLTSGYNHVWLKNRARRPGLSDFEGLDTPEVESRVRDGRFDAFLVLGWDKRCYWQAMRAGWSAGVPMLVRGDSNLRVLTPWWKKCARELTHRTFIGRFAACLAVGRLSREYFEHFGARRVFMSPHCVDNDRFSAASSEACAALRARWGTAPGDTVFLFAGKLEPKKRPMDIVDAVNTLDNSDQARSSRVVFAGDGPLKAALEHRAERNGSVHFEGFVNQAQMPELLSAADVLILPSDSRETWGLIVNEAMAAGRPVIVSDAVGCAPDLVSGQDTGWTYPMGDAAALADRMRRMMGPDPRRRMGENARLIVNERFSVRSAVDGILEAAEAVKR